MFLLKNKFTILVILAVITGGIVGYGLFNMKTSQENSSTLVSSGAASIEDIMKELGRIE